MVTHARIVVEIPALGQRFLELRNHQQQPQAQTCASVHAYHAFGGHASLAQQIVLATSHRFSLRESSSHLRVTGQILHKTTGKILHKTIGETLHKTIGETLHKITGETLHRTIGEILHKTTGETLHKTTGETLHKTTGRIFPRTTGKIGQKTIGSSHLKTGSAFTKKRETKRLLQSSKKSNALVVEIVMT